MLAGEQYYLDLVWEHFQEIESPDNSNYRPIHLAIIHKQLTSLHWLMERGANLNPQDKDGYTPLHLAVSANLLAFALALLSNGASKALLNNDKETPLEMAIKIENYEMAELIGT